MPPSHRPIEVYTNPHGDIVMRQTHLASGTDHTVVVERTHVPALVQRLLEEARRKLD